MSARVRVGDTSAALRSSLRCIHFPCLFGCLAVVDVALDEPGNA